MSAPVASPSNELPEIPYARFRVKRESWCAYQLSLDQWKFRFTPLRLVLLAVTAGGLAVLAFRLIFGLGGVIPIPGIPSEWLHVTNLNDCWPWGIWIARDLAGVALAGGGFGMALLIYVLNFKQFKPIARATMVSSLIGYTLVVISLLIEVGRYWNFWCPAVWWGKESVLFEVFICISCYTIVQYLKFCDLITERVFRWCNCVFTVFFGIFMIILIIFGIVLPSMHQASLQTLYLMMPGKLHPLWFTYYPFVFALLTALFVGPAMIAVEAFVARLTYGTRISMSVLVPLARISGVLIVIFLVLRFADLWWYGRLPLVWEGCLEHNWERFFFWAEIGVCFMLPLLIVFTPLIKFRACLVTFGFLVALGVVLNRTNIVIIGMITGTGSLYIPSPAEILLTVGLCTGGILLWMVFCENFKVLWDGEKPAIAG